MIYIYIYATKGSVALSVCQRRMKLSPALLPIQNIKISWQTCVPTNRLARTTPIELLSLLPVRFFRVICTLLFLGLVGCSNKFPFFFRANLYAAYFGLFCFFFFIYKNTYIKRIYPRKAYQLIDCLFPIFIRIKFN